MKDVVIVGAGVSGLTVGYLLAKNGYDVCIIERESSVGGLARSFYYDNFVFDIGPHRFHTDYHRVLEFIYEILSTEIVTIPRKSGIWLFNRYHDWPINASCALHVPISILAKTTIDHFFTKNNGLNANDNFEAYIIGKYGKTLYDICFRKYTEKFVKINPVQIHRDWAQAGIDRAVIDKDIKMGNLKEFLKSALLPKAVDTKFLYPFCGGIDVFARKLAKKIEMLGGKILLNNEVTGIDVQNEIITGIEYNNGEKIDSSFVIWTAPITQAAYLLNLPPADLKFISIICYNVILNGQPAKDYQWCYYGQDDVIFNRCSIPINFCEATAPPGKHGICLEVTCMENDYAWDHPEFLINTIKKHLLKTKLCEDVRDIESIFIEKIKDCYPLYKTNYKEELKKQMNGIKRYNNFTLLGRSGTFWYNNMDHSIKQALDYAEKFVISGGRIENDIVREEFYQREVIPEM